MTTSRRGFLGALIASASKAKPAESAEVKSRRYILHDSLISGFQQHAGPSLLPQMRAGDRLELVPEPTNIYDEHAVRIEYRGSHIGYIPRIKNRTVSELLAQGAPLECSITSISTDAPTSEAVRVQVSVAVVTPNP